MKTYTKIVTPRMAAEWVKKIKPGKQRKLFPSVVNAYALAMKNGHWTLNHQGIAFDEIGDLCDGQHRLMAIIQSGVSVMMQITHGVPLKQGDLFVFDSIDSGKKRGVAQQLQVRHGIANANQVAAAVRTIATICIRSSPSMTTANTLAIMEYFAKDIEFVSSKMELHSLKKSGVIGGLAFARRASGNAIDTFISRVGDGDGICRGTPEYSYRNFVLRNEYVDHCALPNYSARGACSAAMHSLLGNKLSKVVSSMAGIDFFCDKQPKVVENIRKMFVA